MTKNKQAFFYTKIGFFPLVPMASDAAGQTWRQMEILLRRLPDQQALGPDRQALQHVPAVRIQGERDKKCRKCRTTTLFEHYLPGVAWEARPQF